MRYDAIGRLIRALRQRRGWRQSDLCREARRPRSALVDLEAGRIGRLTVDAIRDFAAALDARVVLTLDTAGSADSRRLLDAGHAFLQNYWKERLERWNWLVRPEVSFNHYGERGRIDLLAFHPATGILLVIEVKTAPVDIQELLGGLDAKVRIAPGLAVRAGWQPTVTVPMLIVASSSSARRRLDDHTALFAQLGVRGRAAAAWLRRPSSASAPSGLLSLSKVPSVVYGNRNRVGRERVRVPQSSARSVRAREGDRSAPRPP